MGSVAVESELGRFVAEIHACELLVPPPGAAGTSAWSALERGRRDEREREIIASGLSPGLAGTQHRLGDLDAVFQTLP